MRLCYRNTVADAQFIKMFVKGQDLTQPQGALQISLYIHILLYFNLVLCVCVCVCVSVCVCRV